MADFGINWGLARPVDVGGSFLAGWEHGQQQRREADTRGALAAYAQNPSIEAAGALASVAPEIGIQAMQREREREQMAQRQQLVGRAVTGDKAALTDLAGVDPALWMKMDDRQKEMVKQSTSLMANAALDVGRLPEEQRAAAWANYVRQAEAGGMDIPAHYEAYSPQALQGVLAEAEMTEKWIKQSEPDWMAVPQGATVVNTHDPASIAAVNAASGRAPGGGGQGGNTVPTAAIEYLRSNPGLAAQFDAKYGAGSAQRYLNGGASPGGSRTFP